MPKNLIINDLVIEVTRRCNMTCVHCLRGEAENLDMDLAYVESLFSKVKGIGTLIFSGGEPSLVPHILASILKLAKRYKVDIGNFYMVTNAKKISLRFVKILMDWFIFAGDSEWDDMPCVQWSNDAYHDEEEQKGIKLLSMLRFASPKYGESIDSQTRRKVRESYDGSLVNQGKASLNYSCAKEPSLDHVHISEEDGGNCRIEDATLYLNCKGMLISGCDWSFEAQDDEESLCRICHIDKMDKKAFENFQDCLEAAEKEGYSYMH